MTRLFILVIDCLPVWIFVIPIMVILQYVVFRQRSFRKFLAALLFAFYLLGVFYVTGIPFFDDFRIDFHFQWIPFVDIVNGPVGYLKNTALNIILFMPMGFLLPAVWKEYRPFKITLLTGFAVSLMIEVLQIFTFRLTDIDDLITNTLGTAAGYYLWKAVRKRLKSRQGDVKRIEEGKKTGWYEPLIILAAVLLIHFFLKPVILDAVWDWVLSSSWWADVR